MTVIQKKDELKAMLVLFGVVVIIILVALRVLFGDNIAFFSRIHHDRRTFQEYYQNLTPDEKQRVEAELKAIEQIEQLLKIERKRAAEEKSQAGLL